MTNNQNTDQLQEWNCIARENAENAIVSSMFEAVFKGSEPIEAFSTWLLVGTAAVASFFITNADKLLPFIKHSGFKICGLTLFFSCLFGLVSKIFALLCKIQNDVGVAVRKMFAEHLAKYQEEVFKIKEATEANDITLETGIRFERVLNEYLIPVQPWIAWLAMRQMKKFPKNPQASHYLVIQKQQWQGIFAGLQALAFIFFLGFGLYFAAST